MRRVSVGSLRRTRRGRSEDAPLGLLDPKADVRLDLARLDAHERARPRAEDGELHAWLRRRRRPLGHVPAQLDLLRARRARAAGALVRGARARFDRRLVLLDVLDEARRRVVGDERAGALLGRGARSYDGGRLGLVLDVAGRRALLPQAASRRAVGLDRVVRRLPDEGCRTRSVRAVGLRRSVPPAAGTDEGWEHAHAALECIAEGVVVEDERDDGARGGRGAGCRRRGKDRDEDGRRRLVGRVGVVADDAALVATDTCVQKERLVSREERGERDERSRRTGLARRARLEARAAHSTSPAAARELI